MIIEFTVANYRSIHAPITLSLEATNQTENPQNIFEAGKYRLLRSAAIYGANASGKSNVIRALMFMRNFVLKSAAKLEPGEATGVARFALHTRARQQPASFQLIFLLNGVRYRYGFELDEECVHSEWLYRTVARETCLFLREGQTFDVRAGIKKESAQIEQKTRENALFLSTIAQFNGALAMEITQWFKQNLAGISGLQDEGYAGYTVGRFGDDETFRERVRELIRLADVGIQDLEVRESPFDSANIPDEVRDMLKSIAQKRGAEISELVMNEVQTLHPVYNANDEAVEQTTLDMDDESEGTQKFFHLLGPILDTLETGKILAVDELDARLHPLLTRAIVRMFNTPETNPHNAQLIFATHDAGLLGECLLRRDQIWFTEKNRLGATELYSLAEFKDERAESAFDTRYLSGRYGGIPFLSRLNSYLEKQFAEQTDGAHP
ncbi:MAG: ATP-binding protein [Anaerolineales bacterium]